MLSGKSVNITANSTLNDETVVEFTGTIYPDGGFSVNRYVANKELYSANKEACRADDAEFESLLLLYKEEA